MKEISRYELYYHVRRIIRGRENLKVNEFIQNNLYLNDIELLDKILLLNITILEKIEVVFDYIKSILKKYRRINFTIF